ncbi:cAMP-binding domain of CRP or a regulatory subunit of cAMP-dependent protein kinases [Pasteurella testudinis DSM 23072]|uniref:cAMP-binding domain of CRP or a regulatory subunit of cAMP-dependent protein kinases n=1 Tax=Pasteurella testudinis DSM 23072 TaxID=1122938 RepID=A0A1W1USM3_9PAST|nr:Crp/Fnr family transcriptional regulator [Pasteurella testudinis]SMB84043.1 cAMP-binding domain of CRP or a regulatory subunit of cAMP-dependent protein kinases [Pasteurella testudinis DSM 23072]SUB50921.1 cyclic nucleotide-binding domain-containing protein [Pasteurella testudinis]
MPTTHTFSPHQLQHCQVTLLHTLEKGTVIYSQGESAKEFYFVQQGLIGLYHLLESGKESLLRIYRHNDYFGFRTLFGENCYHCSAKVLANAEVLHIQPDNIPNFILHNPEVSHFLLKKLANELQDAEHRLAKAAYNKSLDRVIDSIYFLTENYPDYPWTYREIAEYAGCETETAIRISKELKRNGLLKNTPHPSKLQKSAG